MTVPLGSDPTGATPQPRAMFALGITAVVAIVAFVCLPATRAPFYFEDRSLLGPAATVGATAQLPGTDQLLVVPAARRPLATASHSIDRWFADAGGADPGQRFATVAHGHSVAVHLLNVLLLALLIRRLFPNGSVLIALGAAAAFGVHPAQGEAVGYVAARHHLLATLFYLATLHLFVSLTVRATAMRTLLAVASAIAAFLCSEMALSLPFAMLAIRRLVAPAVAAEVVPAAATMEAPPTARGALLVVSVAAAVWFGLLHADAFAPNTARPMDWGESATTAVVTALLASWQALATVVWPTELAIDYTFLQFPRVASGEIPKDALLALLLWSTCLGIAVWRWRQQERSAPIAWAAPLVLLLPALLLPTPIADQALYLPFLAWLLLAAILIAPIVRRYPVVAAAVIAGTLVIWSGTLRARFEEWGSPATFWEQAAAAAPKCAGSQVRFATEALALGRSAESLRALEAACEIFERVPAPARRQQHQQLYHHALLQRARILIGSESPADWQRARELLVAAGAETNASGQRFVERADVLFELFRNSEQLGHRDDAIAAAEKLRATGSESQQKPQEPDVSEHRPYRFEALVYLAGVRREAEQTEAAWALLDEAATACETREQWSRLFYRRGLHQLRDKAWAKARAEFEESARRLEGEGNWVTALYLAAECWVHEGKPNEAVAALQQLSKKVPRHLPTILSMADIQASLDRFDAAEENYRRVLDVVPDNEKALSGLQAVAARRKAKAETPADDPAKVVRTYLSTGQQLLTEKSYPRAVEALRQARDAAAKLQGADDLPLKCEAYLTYARGLTRALQWEAASVVYAEFFEFAPLSECGHAALAAADVLRRRRLVREALSLLETQWGRGARAPGMAMNLGALAVQLRDRDAAVRWYREALLDEQLATSDRERIESLLEQLAGPAHDD
ncbi:MAG: hypothetical protein AAF581_06395 [Planctomycetota bacterium]